MDDLTTRIAEIEAALKQSPRYPNGYAASVICGVIGAGFSTRHSNEYIEDFSAHCNVDPAMVTRRLADLQVRKMACEQAAYKIGIEIARLTDDMSHLDASEFVTRAIAAKEAGE